MPRPRSTGAGAALVGGLATLMLAAPALAQHHGVSTERGAREVASPQLRLAVSDGAGGQVTVVNLENRRVLGRIPLKGSAALYPAGDGRHALATQSGENRVDVIDGGTWSVPHGDHSHHYLRAIRARGTFTGATPIHTVSHDGRLAIFNDATGVAQLSPLARVWRGSRGASRVRSTGAHHGVAVPFAGRTLISLPALDGASLPDGVAIAGARGKLGQQFRSCPGLHGETAVGERTVLFACADGYLAITAQGARLRATTTPAVRGEGNAPRRSGTLVSAHGLPYTIGNLGNQDLVRVHPTRGPLNVLAVGNDRGDFVLDPSSRTVLTVTTDGEVVQLDPVRGTVRARVAAVGAFTLSGGSSVVRPRLAVGHEARVYVSDPAAGRVVELATNPLRVTRTIVVGGRPASMVVLGSPDHDHDHDH